MYPRTFLRYLWLTVLATGLLLLTGLLVSVTGSTAACPDWPLCQGEIFPRQVGLPEVINLGHRFSVVVVGVLIAGAVLITRRQYANQTGLRRWSAALGWLYLLQIGVGGLNAVEGLAGRLGPVHLGLSGIIAAVAAALLRTVYRRFHTLPVSATGPAPEVSPRQKAGVYFRLTKPWILVLLLITTAGAMFIAQGGLPDMPLLLYTLLGGALSAGGASVLNSYIDSDIDGTMSRTSRRPTVTGLVTPEETLFFGLALSTASFLVFVVFVNPLSAALSTLGIIYYVFFYTLYLKRNTIHNIIIGGAAGAIPPLVGWTAVTNRLDLGALYLFAIIFFWTPPHTWALALLVKKDYARARVPMLPVVVGERETTYQIFLYTLLLVALTLLPVSVGMFGWLYLLVAGGLGLMFLVLAWKLWRSYSKPVSKRLYKYSQAYLALLFVAMAVDRAL
ncbi:MAG: protoheme IX farnesyltransferase [Chloroflexi bacterium]|nr:MAG: protoheme IX farnesyltransferase [Chloroflexota bacterium]